MDAVIVFLSSCEKRLVGTPKRAAGCTMCDYCQPRVSGKPMRSVGASQLLPVVLSPTWSRHGKRGARFRPRGRRVTRGWTRLWVTRDGVLGTPKARCVRVCRGPLPFRRGFFRSVPWGLHLHHLFLILSPPHEVDPLKQSLLYAPCEIARQLCCDASYLHACGRRVPVRTKRRIVNPTRLARGDDPAGTPQS